MILRDITIDKERRQVERRQVRINMASKKEWRDNYLRGMEDARYIIAQEADTNHEAGNLDKELALRKAIENIDASFRNEKMKEVDPSKFEDNTLFSKGLCPCCGEVLDNRGIITLIPPKQRFICFSCNFMIDQKVQ